MEKEKNPISSNALSITEWSDSDFGVRYIGAREDRLNWGWGDLDMTHPSR